MLSGFVSRGPAVGEAEVASLEARCGYPLPPDYRKFLLDWNGGERASTLTPEEATVGDGWPREHQFFGLSHGEFDLDERAVNLWGDGGSPYYPRHLLPVAVVCHYGLLVFHLGGPDAGAVDVTFETDGYFEWHQQRVAASFAELLRDFASQEWA